MCRLNALESVVIQSKVALIVVDSVASPVRREYDRETMIERTLLLTKAASVLKYVLFVFLLFFARADPPLRQLAGAFKLCVLVTNQVTAKYDVRSGAGEATVVAALGNTWSHSVNTRLVVEYTDDDQVRRLRIAKSPVAPPASFTYLVDEAGISLIGEDTDWASHAEGAAAPIKSRSDALLRPVPPELELLDWHFDDDLLEDE